MLLERVEERQKWKTKIAEQSEIVRPRLSEIAYDVNIYKLILLFGNKKIRWITAIEERF